MGEIEQTLADVCALIDRVPDYSVQCCHLESDRAVIEIAGEVPALMALQEVCLAANTDIEAWLRGNAQVPGAVVRQTLFPRVTPRDLIDHGSLQLLGIHLAWRLHRLRLLSATKANRLLQRWHAGLVVG